MLMLVSACASAGASGDHGRIRTVLQISTPGQGSLPPPQLPDVTGEFGARPTIARGVGNPPTEPTIAFLTVGTGPRVVPGTRPQVRYAQTDWKTGAVSHDSWAEGIPSEILPATQANLNIISLIDGVQIGSRIQLINPSGDGDARVYVVDVIAQAKAS